MAALFSRLHGSSFDLFLDEVAIPRKKYEYKTEFVKKYNRFINEAMFDFDDFIAFDNIMKREIYGIQFGLSTWKQITEALVNYYGLED